jgi:hypothetical protein
MAADPKTSAGARAERKAFRTYIRRRMLYNSDDFSLQDILDWVLTRQKRYDKHAGGLGKR